MICICIARKTFSEISDILSRPDIEMAEIRLDNCLLSDEEITELFSQSDTPLIATCRATEVSQETAEYKLQLAIEAGARFADLEIEAPAAVSRRFQKLCKDNGTEIIRSYHNFDCTPDNRELQMILARCFRYGADIAKIVTACNSREDAERLESLYSIILEDVDSLQGRLVAFGMGAAGHESRLHSLRRGAPFTYAALSASEATAPGQWTAAEMREAVYGKVGDFRLEAARMPASKSFAQRAIIAAALSEGQSVLHGYTPCADSEAALRVAGEMGAEVVRHDAGDGTIDLYIKGIGPAGGILPIRKLHTGESGLLTRLMIPLCAALCRPEILIEGEGTLPRRPLNGAGSIMAAFGVLLSNAGRPSMEDREVHVPLVVKGKLIPGNAEVSGSAGSQLISGLLMALPLCGKPSMLHVSEPRSIPYMYITLDVLRKFGINTRSEMEGDTRMMEAEDWSYCTGIDFSIKAPQRYKAADFNIEGDWSAAANFLVAGAVFGSAEIEGLDTTSLQADLAIVDILVEAGAVVSQVEADGQGAASVCVRKAPLEGFTTDLNNSPDLFPIVAVLAAFCSGESRIAGIGRLAGKECSRADVIVEMLSRMGVEVSIEGDELVVEGESLAARALGGRLLRGGEYSSHSDHRMAMALQVASLGADGPVVISERDCVGKSFPEFFQYF